MIFRACGLSLLVGLGLWGNVGGQTKSSRSDIRPADLILHHAKIVTPDSESAEALAIVGPHIVAVGSNAAMESWKGPNTRWIDGKGRSVTPGFNDAHVHFLSGSLSLDQVQLLDASDQAEVESRIRSFVASQPNRVCIQGRGWVYGAFEGGLPHKSILDAIVHDRPAIMRCYDGHTVWVNSKTLELAGIDRQTPDPPQGIIVRDASGLPTGVLKEAAQDLIEKVIPQPSLEEKLRALDEGARQALQLGVTSVQEAGVFEKDLLVLEKWITSNSLKPRMRIALEVRPTMSQEELKHLTQLRQRYKHLHLHAVKLYVDGVIEAHTAALLSPYANRPSRGLPEYDPPALDQMIGYLDANDWQIMVHAIGDAGIRMTLDAIEKAMRNHPQPNRERRHRLEHIETIQPQDIARLEKLGVLASMQPFHAHPNKNIFEVWAINLGEERTQRAWAWNSIRKAGGRLAFGTDWPVVGIDPRPGIHVAVTRQTLEGQPADGFLPLERLTLRQTLDAYSYGSAYAEFAEKEKGLIAPGMLADLVVWEEDIFAIPVPQIQKTPIAFTILNGQVAYDRSVAENAPPK